MFSSSDLWCRALEAQADSLDLYRARLKEGYLRLRDRAGTLTTEIGRDAPTLTVHDLTHVDALWEMAELIVGPDLVMAPSPYLNPLEAFVLGAAFIVHDLAQSLAALKMTKDEARVDARYSELLIKHLCERYDVEPSDVPFAKEEDHVQALQAYLRERHSEAAAGLLTTSWNDINDVPQYLMVDSELRESLGELIGRVAASHHWPITRLQRDLDVVGAPAFLPSDWQCDLLKLAAVLRGADVSHVDSRRAPSMLSALRRPKFISKNHWEFQNRLNHPVRREDKILYTSNTSFPLTLVDAWWLCFDTLNYIHKELTSVDNLLLELRRSRFAIKGVVGVEEPSRLARHIPTQGWDPVDTQIRVGNVASLVKRLGGAQLYGENHLAPLRELIQNASDAVRARRILEDQPDDWGQVFICLFKRGAEWILQVTDCGIGMSVNVLTGPLLDFGTSYWSSLEATKEHPGLAGAKFEPTGRFGVGFFSVFMLGEVVKVISRRYDAGIQEIKVLEFFEGADARPLLRRSSGDESRVSGTRVEIILSMDPKRPGGLLAGVGYRNPGGTLAEIVAWLCPCSKVNLVVSEEGSTQRQVISAGDWMSIAPETLMSRMELLPYTPPDERRRINKRSLCNMRPIWSKDGEMVGRACIRLEAPEDSGVITDSGAVIVGGSRAQDLMSTSGVLFGKASRASRDTATPVVGTNEMKRWAEEQRDIVTHQAVSGDVKSRVAMLLRGSGVGVGDLPIGLTRNGWQNTNQLQDFVAGLDHLVVMRSMYMRYAARILPENLESDVVVIESGESALMFLGKFPRASRKWREPKFHERSQLMDVLIALSLTWREKIDDLLKTAEHPDEGTVVSAIIGKDAVGNSVLTEGAVIFRRRPTREL